MNLICCFMRIRHNQQYNDKSCNLTNMVALREQKGHFPVQEISILWLPWEEYFRLTIFILVALGQIQPYYNLQNQSIQRNSKIKCNVHALVHTLMGHILIVCLCYILLCIHVPLIYISLSFFLIKPYGSQVNEPVVI
jgi:hypothetical protein